MATNVYVQYDFPKELMFQLPFVQIFDLAKSQRIPYWRKIEAEIEIITKDNKQEIIDLFGNSMIKAMDEDVRLGNISEDTLKEVRAKIDYLNSKFKYVNEYFESLDAYGQRSLLLPFIEKEINLLIRYKEKFRTIVTSKESWDYNDSIMYSYYLLYLENLTVWRNLLKMASRDRISGRLNFLKELVFIYKPILIAYMLNKPFPNGLLVRRIAELRAGINPTSVYITEPKIYEASKRISAISPI